MKTQLIQFKLKIKKFKRENILKLKMKTCELYYNMEYLIKSLIFYEKLILTV